MAAFIDGIPILASKGLQVYSLGEIVNNPNFFRPNGTGKAPTIFPVGFICTRTMPSIKAAGGKVPREGCTLRFEIASVVGAVGSVPVFHVSTSTTPDQVFSGPTCTRAIDALYESWGLPSPSGPAIAKFGLTDEVVCSEIAKLPGYGTILAQCIGDSKPRNSSSAQIGHSEAKAISGTAAITKQAKKVNATPSSALVSESTAELLAAVVAPQGPKRGKKAAEPDFPNNNSIASECPLCHVALNMPFCAATGKPHTPADSHLPKPCRSKSQKPAAVDNDKASTIEVSSAVATPIANEKKPKRVGAAFDPDPTVVVPAVVDMASVPKPLKRGPRAESRKDGKPVCHDAQVESDGSIPSKNIISIEADVVRPMAKGSKSVKGLDANQPTLDTLFAKAPPGANIVPSASKKPRIQVAKQLLDPTSAKKARTQLEAFTFSNEGRLGSVIHAPGTAAFNKVQKAKYMSFLWEFMGEGVKVDLIKKCAPTSDSAIAVVNQASE